MANEQDRSADSGQGAAPADGPSAGHGRPTPAPVSMWADMLISGPDEAAEPEPDGPAQPSGYDSLHEGALGWQRPTWEQAAPEQTAPDQAAPDQAAPDQAGWEQPAPRQHGWQRPTWDQAAPGRAASEPTGGRRPAPGQHGWEQPAWEPPAWQQPAWPASPLPPSSGQRPVEGEKPAFDGPAPPVTQSPVTDVPAPHTPAADPYEAEPHVAHIPAADPREVGPPAVPGSTTDPDPIGSGPDPFGAFAAEPGYAGYRPLDQPGAAAAAGYTPTHARPVGDDPAQPDPPGTPAADVTDDPDWGVAAPSYDPWETYEPEAGHGWTGGYGFIAPEEQAPPAEPGQEPAEAYRAGGGYPPPYDRAAPREEEPAEPADERDDGEAVAYLGYGFVVPEQEGPGSYRPSRQNGSADSLTADVLLPGRHTGAPSGWRRALYQFTGGLVRAHESAADRHRAELVARARTPVANGHHRVAVLSLKGGVGKTTTAVGLGGTLASLRGDRIMAMDANPDRGTLCDKLRLETAATVRDLLNESGHIRRYADVRAYTTQAPSGLEVLASDRDPTVSVAFSGEDYEDVAAVLENHYSVCIADCGTGLLHSAMAGVLGLADQIVLVSSPSVDGARSASATLDWLTAHQYGDLVRGAVVVLSAIRPHSKSTVDLGRLEQHFAARCRAVVRIPHDAHLEEGAEMDLGQLSRATADAYLVLAAEVADGFAG